jgi:hypothetical protein
MTDSIPPPRYTLWQSIAVAVGLSTRALEEVRRYAATPRRIPTVKEWSDGVHYEGTIVTHLGQSWQARRDTGRPPPSPFDADAGSAGYEDWQLIAARGQDAPVGEVRGLHDTSEKYRRFDLVVANGSEWRAKRDDPGPLPGNGWALSAQKGDRGKRGEQGDRGLQGPPGQAAPAIAEWIVKGYQAIPLMADGTLGPALDLEGMFEAYHADSGAG